MGVKEHKPKNPIQKVEAFTWIGGMIGGCIGTLIVMGMYSLALSHGNDSKYFVLLWFVLSSNLIYWGILIGGKIGNKSKK